MLKSLVVQAAEPISEGFAFVQAAGQVGEGFAFVVVRLPQNRL